MAELHDWVSFHVTRLQATALHTFSSDRKHVMNSKKDMMLKNRRENYGSQLCTLFDDRCKSWFVRSAACPVINLKHMSIMRSFQTPVPMTKGLALFQAAWFTSDLMFSMQNTALPSSPPIEEYSPGQFFFLTLDSEVAPTVKCMHFSSPHELLLKQYTLKLDLPFLSRHLLP